MFEYTEKQQEIQPQLEAANINPSSFLATDYLNHFNEIVMLLEMLPDMPELAEDACEWKPKSYTDHFRDSGFQAKDLAILAFEEAPREIRNSFEDTCQTLDNLIVSTLAALEKVGAAERGLSDQARTFLRNRIEEIQSILASLNGIIHGKLPTPATSSPTGKADSDSVQTQQDIDQLFD